MWNRMLKGAIDRTGGGLYEVILPQDEANKFISGSNVDRDSIAQECFDRAEAADVAIAILDGSDADSGTCVEVAWRKGRNAKLPVIGVRTDFRLSEDEGFNLMLRRGRSTRMCDVTIYFPSFDEDVNRLAEQIVDAIQKMRTTA